MHEHAAAWDTAGNVAAAADVLLTGGAPVDERLNHADKLAPN